MSANTLGGDQPSADGPSADGLGDETIRHVLTTTRRIALVGASAKPWRASQGVMRFLLDHGFDVTPVNPALAGQTLHGRTVVARLAEAVPLDMVDVFRNASHTSALVDEAMRLQQFSFCHFGAFSLFIEFQAVRGVRRRPPSLRVVAAAV